MKKLICKAAAVCVGAIFCTVVYAGDGTGLFDDINDALKNGKFSADLQLYYFNRDLDATSSAPAAPDAKILAAGGVFKYKSAPVGNVSVAGAYYGSHNLLAHERDDAAGTSMARTRDNDSSNNDDIAFLGEAYVQVKTEHGMLRAGRQRLNTPLANDHLLRLLPTSYEGIVVNHKIAPNTTAELAYVTRNTRLGSSYDGFDDQDDKYGDDNLAYAYVKTQQGALAVRAQYVEVLDNAGLLDSMMYVDSKIDLPIHTGTFIQGQYSQSLYSDNAANEASVDGTLRGDDDSEMYGFKIGTTLYPNLDVAAVYNNIKGNDFQVIEAGPMYTDWQQGYGVYEASEAIGGYAVVRPSDNLSVKMGYVDVQAKSDKNADTDDYSEMNIDSSLALSDVSKLRFRYSLKNQEEGTTRGDRDDVRLIYYHSF